MAKQKRAPVLIDLALQGGGSHGAFTWGVLDRLLEEPWLQVEAISGTSAGAMNAVVLASGWDKGWRRRRARRTRCLLGSRSSKQPLFSPVQRTPDRPRAWALVARQFTGLHWPPADGAGFSPYDLNPRGYNPLTTILEQSIDFEHLAQSSIKLFVTATNVRTGRGRIFRNAEITPDVCSRRHACRRCFRPSRSMARLTGMAATQAIRRLRR